MEGTEKRESIPEVQKTYLTTSGVQVAAVAQSTNSSNNTKSDKNEKKEKKKKREKFLNIWKLVENAGLKCSFSSLEEHEYREYVKRTLELKKLEDADYPVDQKKQEHEDGMKKSRIFVYKVGNMATGNVIKASGSNEHFMVVSAFFEHPTQLDIKKWKPFPVHSNVKRAPKVLQWFEEKKKNNKSDGDTDPRFVSSTQIYVDVYTGFLFLQDRGLIGFIYDENDCICGFVLEEDRIDATKFEGKRRDIIDAIPILKSDIKSGIERIKNARVNIVEGPNMAAASAKKKQESEKEREKKEEKTEDKMSSDSNDNDKNKTQDAVEETKDPIADK